MTQAQDTPEAPAKVPAQAPAPAPVQPVAAASTTPPVEVVEVASTTPPAPPAPPAPPTEAAPQPVFTADTYQAAAQAFSASRQKVRDAKAANVAAHAGVAAKDEAVRIAETNLDTAKSQVSLSDEDVADAEAEGQESARSLRAILDAYLA